MQLQAAKRRFEKQGIGLAGISYDSRAILADFSRRHRIDFPLLADPDSKTIAAYQVLNQSATGMTKGMAHPGFVFIDPSGAVRETYFETVYTDRFTANNLIAKMFPELVEETRRSVEAPHLKLTMAQSDRVGIPGSVISLVLDVTMPARTHVYAPTVTGGYIPISLTITPSSQIEIAAARYPAPRTLHLDVIKETVPVFNGRFRIVQDVKIATSKAMIESIGKGKSIEIAGVFKYQACDDRVCYAPTSLPVTWRLEALPFDRERAPESIRHR